MLVVAVVIAAMFPVVATACCTVKSSCCDESCKLVKSMPAPERDVTLTVAVPIVTVAPATLAPVATEQRASFEQPLVRSRDVVLLDRQLRI